jgi:hypothetical protein
MPIEKVPNTSLSYYLIAFDEDGNERNEPNGKKLSESILTALANGNEPITDVFIISHGWLGDIPAARQQYNDWIGVMAKQTADLERIKKSRPKFNPLLIGFHWPSKPWGDENLGASISFDVNDEVNKYAQRISDTGTAKKALETIFSAAERQTTAKELDSSVLDAYQVLSQEANLGSDSEDGAPGSDWEGFDPQGIYQVTLKDQEDQLKKDRKDQSKNQANQEVSFGSDGDNSLREAVLNPLRVLSYWKMKDRARKIGESGGFNLLKSLQQKSQTVRFHLIGHSFGCVVVSAIVNGPKGTADRIRPVNSLVLIQGALSLWSYAPKVKYADDRPGYFYPIVAKGKVSGPIITTYSDKDYAVGKMYPLAGKVVQSEVDYGPDAELPKYGGIGSFGIGGEDLNGEHSAMRPADYIYDFKPGKIYNLQSNDVIKNEKLGGRTSGAHCDIVHPEVAHVVWSAAEVI